MRNLSGLKLASKKSIKTCDGCKKNEKVVDSFLVKGKKDVCCSNVKFHFTKKREFY